MRISPGFHFLFFLALLLQGCAGLLKGSDSGDDGFDGKAVQQALLTQYLEWQGTPYRLGGESRAGIDCSAFVQQTLKKHFSIMLPRSTDQQVTAGKIIPRESARPGDLLFFKTGRSTRHVGFYMGEGQFLHASTTEGVTISRLNDAYWQKTFWTARRVL
ncbi:MAG TPA: NlpC/P60 family protein [Limnobacter sp.]|nr:NlpC/P60 family protein [Limnobacter sp.]